jgi:hypothetical protein
MVIQRLHQEYSSTLVGGMPLKKQVLADGDFGKVEASETIAE